MKAPDGHARGTSDPLACAAELDIEEEIATDLEKDGLSIRPLFFSLDDAAALGCECLSLGSLGALRPAAVGSSERREVRHDVRGDQLLWIAANTSSLAQRAVLTRMEALRTTLNRRLWLGLSEFECHFSLYATGASYARHLDRFRDDDRRKLSCVLYLNEGWSAAAGGALRIYLHPLEPCDSADPLHLDVLPVGGTLVTFLSDRFEHEVLAATEPRASIAGWFRTRH